MSKKLKQWKQQWVVMDNDVCVCVCQVKQSHEANSNSMQYIHGDCPHVCGELISCPI